MNTEELQSDQNTDATIARLTAECERLKADAKAFMAQRDAEKARADRLADERDYTEARMNNLRQAIPGTYGEAVLKWPCINCEGHEWDNRRTEENAIWMINQLMARADKAERAYAEMREALQDAEPPQNCGDYTHRLAWIRQREHALSSDCGRDHFHKRELEPTRALLRRVIREEAYTILGADAGEELARLEALVKGAK